VQPLPDDNTLALGYVMEMSDKTDLALKAQLETLAQSVDLESFVRTCQEQQLLPPAMKLDAIQQYLVRLKANDRSQFDYHPQSIPVPIHLFRAMEGNQSDWDDYLGWADVLPESQICVIPIPGTHHSMVESPQIEVLGRSLSDVIS
jgi:thioesterase domain-containing protein